MKAFRVEQPEIARVVDIPDISAQDHEVLLQVKMVGMCGQPTT